MGLWLVIDGEWRSPVAHLNGVQGVAGSNPAVPTICSRGSRMLKDSAEKVLMPGHRLAAGLLLLYAAFRRGKVGLISTITATEGAIAAVIARSSAPPFVGRTSMLISMKGLSPAR